MERVPHIRRMASEVVQSLVQFGRGHRMRRRPLRLPVGRRNARGVSGLGSHDLDRHRLKDAKAGPDGRESLAWASVRE
jgi:hypothetical protein